MSIDAPEFSAPIDAPGMTFDAPDHTKSRTVPPGIKRALGKMGNNKKPRGGPRQLNAEDINRLEEYYDGLAWAMSMYKPAVADAIHDTVTLGEGDDVYTVTRARMCAEAWGDLAKENDSVRRLILMMVETGVWSKVIMVNLPILVAALPDDALSRLMFRFMPNPTRDDSEETLVNVA
jgi:hypothetical protein